MYWKGDQALKASIAMLLGACVYICCTRVGKTVAFRMELMYPLSTEVHTRVGEVIHILCIPLILTDGISTCKIPHHSQSIAQRDSTLIQSTLC